MDSLLTLLTLQRQAQDSETRAEFLHVVANESRKLLPYRQMIVWSRHAWGVSLDKISGNALLDEHGQYATDLKKQIEALDAGETEPVEISHGTSEIRTFLQVATKQDGVLGGLCFETENPYGEKEKEILKELAVSYAPLFALHALRGGHGMVRQLSKFVEHKKYILMGLCLVALFPTRMSVTAPIEIVPRDAQIVTAPFNGTVTKVEVSPGEMVNEGAPLILMDDTILKGETEMAGQDFKISTAQLSKARREALASPDKKSELGTLEAELAGKEIKLRYASEMERKSTITAARAGTAIFGDKSTLEGQPVRTGDVLMKIANAGEYEALVRIPVSSLIPFEKDAVFSFFLNVHPATEYYARITSNGYEATEDSDGLLTYKIRGDVMEKDLRIGWQGTAKIKGPWTVFAYTLLRRPILSLRRVTGW